jgi:taurine dioxygenase
MALTLTPKDAALGAEVTNVDRGGPVSADTTEQIRMALCEHGVLTFPGQEMSTEAQVALTRHLGEPEVHVLSDFTLRGLPEVFIVSNVRKGGKPVGAVNAGQELCGVQFRQ